MAGPVDMVQSPVKSDYYLSGPIAGVIAAQQLADADAAQSRNFRNNDLSYASDLNKYQNDLANNPIEDMKRQLAIASGQEDLSMHQSGDIMAAKKAELEAKIQESMSKKTLGQIKDDQARLEWARDASQQLDFASDNTPAGYARNKDVYETQILPRAKMVGADKGLPPAWGPDAAKEMQMRSTSAEHSLPFVQKMAVEKEQTSRAESVARITASGHLKSAQVMAGVNQQNKIDLMDPDRKIEMEIDQFKKDGQPIPIGKVQELSSVYDKGPASTKAITVAKQVATAAETSYSSKSAEIRATMNAKEHLPANASVEDYTKAVMTRELNEQKASWLSARLGNATIIDEKGNKVRLGPDGKLTPVKETPKPSKAAESTTATAVSTGPKSPPPGYRYMKDGPKGEGYYKIQ